MPLRKQYHFRESERGLLAWDVESLVALSKGMEVIQIKLQHIQELGEPYWFSTGGRPDCKTVARHAQLIFEADLSYPIILCPEGRVMDGMHRVCRAFIEQYGSISAVQFSVLSEPDYIGVAPDELPY